jgi:hypothetical protein
MQEHSLARLGETLCLSRLASISHKPSYVHIWMVYS